MNDQNFGEPKYGDWLFHSINSFAFWAFVSTFFHPLSSYKIVKAIRNTWRWFGYLDREVHEIVKSQTFMATLLALYHAHQLSFKQVRYYWIVPVAEISIPYLWLFYHWLLIAVNLLILWFFANSVEFIMHAIQEETEEFLSILLTIPWELSSYPTHLRFKVTRCHYSTLILPGFPE